MVRGIFRLYFDIRSGRIMPGRLLTGPEERGGRLTRIPRGLQVVGDELRRPRGTRRTW